MLSLSLRIEMLDVLSLLFLVIEIKLELDGINGLPNVSTLSRGHCSGPASTSFIFCTKIQKR